jgi:hypothetical protein
MAAKNATVLGNGVVLLAGPDKSSEVLGHLANGESIEISNYPTQGFYKVRTGNGQVGWIDSAGVNKEAPLPPPEAELPQSAKMPPAPDTLSSPGASETKETSPENIPYEDIKSTDRPVVESREQEAKPKPHRHPYELKAFGGIQKIQFTEVNNLLGTTVFSATKYFGIQFGVPLEERLLAVIRIERLTNSTSAGATNLSLSSTPVTAGLSYAFVKQKPILLQGSVLLGPAFSTTLDATATDLAAPNMTELSTTAFTELLKLDLGMQLSSAVELFIEGGYRFLKTSSVGPTTTVNGSALFQSNGVNVPVPLDLSGPFIGGGLGFFF